MDYINNESNILLAYRNIKNNKGSKTVGTDNKSIEHLKNLRKDEFIELIQNKFSNYTPKSVRRQEIPKQDGRLRPLGIPCIDDRIIQQCIKQVLEPICEAKFHKHSYGFRPNRSTSHAIARCMFLMNRTKLHYAVDIDIKGFFDNVNHSKLKKQLWKIGIRDKNLLSILGKILKSEIDGIGVPEKGTPQGGIISPLLANVVLNELDWWISSQWETFETKKSYKNKYQNQRTTNLKEMWLVRYADDFKIFCRDYKSAIKIFNSVKQWLKERLGLDISNEKSKITNLRKNYTEFLGFRLKVKLKRNKYVCNSKITKKAKQNIIAKLKEQVKIIQKKQKIKEVSKLNSMILGVHNYYKYATHVSMEFSEIDFLVRKTLKIRLRSLISSKPRLSETHKRLYGRYNGKPITIIDTTMFPIYGCKTKTALCFSQDICNYTKRGRKLIHDNLFGYTHVIQYLLNSQHDTKSVEFNDNKISLIAGQKGRCAVTGEALQIGNMECHHKRLKSLGGTDEYKNLVWISTQAHKLIHSTNLDTIAKYLNVLNLDNKGFKQVNSLRKLVGNSVI
ncbi:group II intron reverse transcriptase/maturase [Clostridium botulinum]|uniref:group II intron reverse transcriptase/maturase n=1 Tax=Clostridium botulinum TaxID=1491 RepID=UPI000A420A8A|nr:group II intron reverse transcriptase/maturase [Clostridium botulinum]